MAECALPKCRSVEPCLVCPYQFSCPTCPAGPGGRCHRPSGHRCQIHEPRIVLADRHAILLHPDHVRERLGEEAFDHWCQQVASVG